MADQPEQLLTQALSRAAAEPAGRPLVGSRAAPGLFANSAPGKHAARLGKDAGYFHVLHTQTKGKTVQEVCTISEKGLTFLLSQTSPRQVLEQLGQAVEARGEQLNHLINSARQCHETLTTLKRHVEEALHQLNVPIVTASISSNGSAAWKTELLSFLARWPAERSHEDCPLPDAYRHALTSAAALSIGQFHDGLRSLHEQGHLYLHPWTGPLYEIPEPAYALLIGHSVAYYASRRSSH